MNKFLFYEEEGRKAFKSFLDQSRSSSDWQPTKDPSDTVDGFFKLKDKKIVVEIKTRDSKYMDYATHFMEINKYMNVSKQKVDKGCYTGLYVNIFGDSDKGIYDTMYIYDLKDINSTNCEITTTYANKTTAKETGKIRKQFYMIPVRYAQKFKKINNRWIKIP